MTFYADITRLHFIKPVTAGMDPYVLMALVPLMRKTTEDHPPIVVRPSRCCPEQCWEVLDGRHRWIAAVMGGRSEVLAELEG